MSGLLGDLFDLNGDGELDYFERAMELEFMTSMEEEAEEEDEDEEEKDWDMTELEIAGLNPEELEFMDASERRKILDAAGLNPDAFDF